MKQANPLVSIIIPTLNRARLIPDTLHSILRQNYGNWECIVVDDGSTDESIQAINEFVALDSRFKLFKRPPKYKSGANGARNYGFDLSKGEYIQWFDSDDLMDENMLSDKIRIFKRYPEYQSVISRLSFFNENNQFIRQSNIKEVYNNLFENVLTWNVAVWTPNIMFRKEFLVDSQERFDESLHRLQDYDFMSRIFIKHEHKSFLLAKDLCYIRRNNPDSITARYFKSDRIIELEKSEYIVARKIINLLIAENKFSNYLIKYFYKDHLKRISKLIRHSDHKLVESFKNSVELFLNFNEKYFKLFRFHLGLALFKTIPVDNLFLIYRPPFFINFMTKNVRRLYRICFERGYFSEKLFDKKLKKLKTSNLIHVNQNL